ncbi:carboxyltransferase domain-containing protein [Portibacter marinus]|uniref:carboxyltransferase domain-containing protein n=1 Tax=Portibacter marinus TaxID=2898660 RepID=UPI0021D448E4|nr:carboxyltransferase domain-containing protein [Portibacter marinus]
MDSTDLHFKYYHDDFLIIESNDFKKLRSMARNIYEANFEFCEEVIAAETEVLIKLSRRLTTDEEALIRSIKGKKEIDFTTFTLPVYFDYDHKDWNHIKKVSGLDSSEFVDQILKLELEVSMYGFLPGFTYISGLPKHLQIPRKSIPEKYVSDGSLAIGGKYLGIYTISSPGGWNVVGQTPIQLIDTQQIPMLPWKPGDHIQLKLIDRPTFRKLAESQLSLKEYHS